MFRFAAFALGCLTLASSSWAIILPTGPNCPAVYQPTVCSQDEISASGTNRCFAMADLQKALNMQGIALNPEDVKCARSDLAVARVTRPTCGIVPTTTTCSITVGDQDFRTRAHDCDSAIPELRERLSNAGLDPTGLVAACTREQFGEQSDYTVAL